MVVLKESSYGLDSQLERIQLSLERNLEWINTVGSDNVVIFGQIQKIGNNKGTFNPNSHINKKDYDRTFFNDRKSAIIGFIPSETRTFDNGITSIDVDVVFTFNIKEVHDNTQNNTEKAILEGFDVLMKSGYLNVISNIKTGVNEVFNGFDLSKIKFNDMYPLFCFSISTNIIYANDLCVRSLKEKGILFTADNNTITADNNTITIDQIRI